VPALSWLQLKNWTVLASGTGVGVGVPPVPHHWKLLQADPERKTSVRSSAQQISLEISLRVFPFV
jgi:hypothetical protein